MTNSFLIFVFALLFVLFLICVYLAFRDIRKTMKEKEEKELKAKTASRKKLLNIEHFLYQIKIAKTLNDVFILHIQIWANDIRNHNIGSNSYGIFRTDDILMMKKDEVYLYIPYYSHTFRLDTLEKKEDEAYEHGLQQYKQHLISNLQAIKKELENE